MSHLLVCSAVLLVVFAVLEGRLETRNVSPAMFFTGTGLLVGPVLGLVHVPIGRFARAEEIAAGALFLASDESSFVTATTFLVDGGLSGAYVTPE